MYMYMYIIDDMQAPPTHGRGGGGGGGGTFDGDGVKAKGGGAILGGGAMLGGAGGGGGGIRLEMEPRCGWTGWCWACPIGGVGQFTGVLDLCSIGDGEYTILLLWPVSDETVRLRIPNSVWERERESMF